MLSSFLSKGKGVVEGSGSRTREAIHGKGLIQSHKNLRHRNRCDIHSLINSLFMSLPFSSIRAYKSK